jgi:hypothetical protein
LTDFEHTVHVRDLPIPGDVTLLTDVDEVVARVQAPRIEVEEEPVAAEEGAEEGAEGAAAEGAAGTEGASDQAGGSAGDAEES